MFTVLFLALSFISASCQRSSSTFYDYPCCWLLILISVYTWSFDNRFWYFEVLFRLMSHFGHAPIGWLEKSSATFLSHFHQILADFHNSFTATLHGKLAIKWFYYKERKGYVTLSWVSPPTDIIWAMVNACMYSGEQEGRLLMLFSSADPGRWGDTSPPAYVLYRPRYAIKT